MRKAAAIVLLFTAQVFAVQLPAIFEKNAGQAAGDVRFVSRTNDGVISLLDRGFRVGGAEVHFVGCNPKLYVEGLDQLPGRSNYLLGRDPAKWRTGIAQFGRVAYRNLYPGIDLIFHGKEYDLMVAPRADPGRVQLDLGDTAKLDGG